ncbi:MAG: GNAT family N-acetyltransferase [bacterium]|nr:GNAT family N-acetyltransferase [bacterium]
MLKIVVPDRERHLGAISDLWGSLRRQCAGHLTDPYCDWATSRVGLLDDRVVTFWGVFGLDLRVDSASLRTAGVNWVATHSGYRRKGRMEETGQAALAAMREQGYDLTVMNGIEGYYERFGYVFAWPKVNFYLSADVLPSDKPGVQIQEFTPGHREDLAAIYNRTYAGVTGTAVRPTHRSFKWPGEFQGYAWLDESGKTAGYVVGSRGSRSGYPFDCVDAAGDPEAILQVVGFLAHRWGYREIQFDRIPLRSMLVQQLRQLGCTVEADYPQSGGYMIRIVNLHSLLEKLCGVLSERLKRSHFQDWQGHLLIGLEKEGVILEIDRGSVCLAPSGTTDHAIRGGDRLAQLVVGTEAPDEVMDGMQVNGQAKELVEVLFPKQDPQLSVVDL